MIKHIKSYKDYGENCGIAKQVQGKEVDALQDNNGKWHFEYENEKWVASDYAFETE